jgi:circadian clock protein KaiB
MSRATKIKLKLFVAGNTENSTQAMTNLNALCAEFLPQNCEIEIIDVFRDPKLATAAGVFMTPTLLKVSPEPRRTVVGTLSETGPVLQALGLGAVTK